MFSKKSKKRKQKVVGDFEYTTLIAIRELGPKAYGKEIAELLDEKEDTIVSSTQIYKTLERLQTKELITRVESSDESRRKIFVLTKAGVKAVETQSKVYEHLATLSNKGVWRPVYA